MGDSFYHMFATLYLLFVRTTNSRNVKFVNKRRKIDVLLWHHNQRGVVQGAKWCFDIVCSVDILGVIIKIYVMSDIHRIKE
jgi:hypothetical protein